MLAVNTRRRRHNWHLCGKHSFVETCLTWIQMVAAAAAAAAAALETFCDNFGRLRVVFNPLLNDLELL